MNGRDPNDSCPKLKAVLEKGRREKTALDSQILSPSVQLGVFYFLPSVMCRAYNAPSLQIPVLKTRRMGTHGSEISPWRHPILPLFRKPNPLPPAQERRDRTARKPSSRSCHHPGWRTAGSFGARPPRREQLFPVISASQGSKCALLQPLAGSQLGNSFSLSCPCSCGEKLQTCVHTYTFTHALLSSLKKTISKRLPPKEGSTLRALFSLPRG